MAKKVVGKIKLQIEAGKANPSPPVGPALGQHGVNIMDFCKQFNARTESQAGYIIPVVIDVYEDRSFSFIVKSPPAPVLIKKALNLVLNYPPVKVVFLNVLGGITRADDVARGVIAALEDNKWDVNIVTRLTGTNEEEGQRLLEEAGIPYEISLEEAAKKAVAMCEEIKAKEAK